MTEAAARCFFHDVSATGVCARCGRFGCAACLSAPEGWCADCLGRDEVRLTPSRRAKQALLLALLGLHGVLVVLPVAWWLAARELESITAGTAPSAGRPWAQGARWLVLAALVGWALLISRFLLE
ncbi:MAG: hypothetical protein ACOZQL_07045 [Myxococcota bacterium]